jgi:3-dehydroquinate synthase
VVADATVARLHGATLAASLDAAGLAHAMATFPAGEPSKSLATAERLWSACAEQRLDRGGLIVALGGGVAGDLAGFTAACWMRGVRFVQIPTTLLAMVDSSVGGKTGVNSAAGKNLVGAFHQPSLVIADTAVLTTMDDREYRAGLAEVLKYGVIREPDFLAWQEANAEALAKRDGTAIAHAVRESCRIKAAYVVEDETEQGVRAHLNYGHTFGHALEGRTAYTRYLHGEAVGIGMRMAADLAQRLGLLETPDLLARQDALLRRYGLPLRHEGEADRPAALADLVRRCGLDKKVAAGRTRFIVPRRPGAIELISAPDEALVAAAFASAMA